MRADRGAARHGRAGDRGNLAVVEAMLVAVLLFGAVVFTLYAPLPGDDDRVETAEAEALASDLLRVLAKTPSATDYASRLDEVVSQAVLGNVSGAQGLARLLPTGAGYGLYLDNGVAPKTLYERGLPTGAVASSDDIYYPAWDRVLAFADLEGHAGTSAADTMRIRTFPLDNSYLVRTGSAALLYANGVNTGLTPDAAGAWVTTLVPPESEVTEGYDVPYDLSNFNSSVATHALGTPVPFAVRTSLVDPWSGTAYRVHPSFSIDAGLRTYANAGGHTSLSATSVAPGDAVTLAYDFSGLPPGSGSVLSRTVTVHGPAPDLVVATATLTGTSGTWTYTVPRDALYGTYVFDTQVVLASGSLQQVVHDATSVDVLRPRADAPGAAVYRVVLAVWFNGL